MTDEELSAKFKELEQQREQLKQSQMVKEQETKNMAVYLEQQLKEKNEQYRNVGTEQNTKPISYTPSFMERVKIFFGKSRQLLINMEMINGDFTTFIIFMSENIDSFKWNGKTFVIDESCKLYNVKFKLWYLNYHESLALPIKTKINPNDFIVALQKDGVTDVEMSINPTTLEYFIISNVIQKVIKGADMEKVFDFMKLLLIILVIECTAILILFIKGSGILNNIKMPF
jgi:hypothetical protein